MHTVPGLDHSWIFVLGADDGGFKVRFQDVVTDLSDTEMVWSWDFNDWDVGKGF